jgi:hypothetical protein
MRLADPGADQNGKRLKFERARIIGAKQGPVSLQFLNRLSRNGRDLDGALVHDRLELFQRREGSVVLRLQLAVLLRHRQLALEVQVLVVQVTVATNSSSPVQIHASDCRMSCGGRGDREEQCPNVAFWA